MPTRTDEPRAHYELTDKDIKIARVKAYQFAKKRKLLHLVDELTSAAFAGLAKARLSFDASKGFKFWTHADARVIGEMKDWLRETMPLGYRRPNVQRMDLPETVSIDTPLFEPFHGHARILVEDFPHNHEDTDWADAVQWMASTLGRVRHNGEWFCYGDIFISYYLHARTMRETARLFNLSESRVSQILSQARAQLKAMFDRCPSLMENVA